MPPIKISQLQQLTNPQPNDEFPINNGGVTKKSTPGQLSADYRALAVTPTATYLGNRSYSLNFSGVDYSGVFSPGTRLVTVRSTPAPVQSSSFNGTNQFWSKLNPDKLAFTDDFAVSAWIKISAYKDQCIVSRSNSTNGGWRFQVQANGQLSLYGYNSGYANNRIVSSYHSIPINQWVHVTAQLDMSAYTLSPSTCYIMIDGYDVPCYLEQNGSGPSSMTPGGNLEVGSFNGGTAPFQGSMAQVAVWGAKQTQDTIRSYISQGLSGAESNIASAYSFSGNANDLNTTTPNNLSSNGSVSTNTNDSPFGGQSNNLISPTIDYAIVQAITYTSATIVYVQVPVGCTIPTTGGVSAITYATTGSPNGFPLDKDRWRISSLILSNVSQANQGVWQHIGGFIIRVPVGSWMLGFAATLQVGYSSNTFPSIFSTLSKTISTEDNRRFSTWSEGAGGGNSISSTVSRAIPVTVSAAQTYYYNQKTQNVGGTAYIRGDIGAGELYADNAYL